MGGGVAGNPWPVLDLKEFFHAGARVMGVSMVITAWGEGVNVASSAPPPSRQIVRRPPKTRIENTGQDPGHAPMLLPSTPPALN